MLPQIVDQIVPAFEAAFPSRIRGVYVHGSYADDSAVATSDLDLIVLFKDAFEQGEKARAEQVAAEKPAAKTKARPRKRQQETPAA